MTGPSFATPAATPVSPAAPPPAPKPAPARPAAVKPGNKPDDGGGMRVLTYLRLHWLMIAFCGSLLGTAGAFAAWELLASKYESYAMLQVTSAPTALANQNPNQARTDFATYVKTTSALIKSEFVLNAALRDIKDLPTIKAQSDPLKYLDEEILVTWQDGSEVIRVTFKGHEPNDAKKIVDAVQKAFMSEVIQKDVQEKQRFLKTVEDAQIEMKRILDTSNTKQAKPGAVKQADGRDVPAAAPPGMSPNERLYQLDPRFLLNEFVALDREVKRLPVTIRDFERRELVLKKNLETLQEAPIPQATRDMIDKDQDVIVQKLRMLRAKNEYEFRLNAAAPDQKNAPGILDLKAAYDSQAARYEEVKKEKINTLDGLRRTEVAQKMAYELEDVVRRKQQCQEQLDTAKALLATAAKQLGEIPMPSEKGSGGIMQAGFTEKPYDTADTQRLTIDGIYGRLVAQQEMTKLELTSPPRVRILQAASHPTQKDMKKQVLGTVFAGIMGFVVVAMGVVGYETVGRRVSSLADVKTAVPSPVVGVIPCEPGAAMGRDPVKRAAANEAIDKLRAYVSQTWLSRGATTIAVTSPIGDEGKAFAAFGLASSLAQAGYKTLLVDFDLREPALHTLAGVPNLAGACELLRAETDMRSAVQFLPSGLHLLPAGKWSDEARKAATGEKLENLLTKLKEPYDCVVIHGHALLTVAESVEVARRCEVVLVCARYRETTMPLLKRATERVATMEIPFSGVVYVGASEQESLC